MIDVVIIGGGASGVSAAIELKKINNNLKVVILEQNDKILKKVLKTGNGKCNISNSGICKEKFNDFSLIEKHIKNIDIKDFFLNEGLVLKELDCGRMYPYSETSSSVVNILLESIKKYNIEVVNNYKVSDIKKEKDIFVINNDIKAKYVVFSTGSKSQEKTNGYEILKKLGHKITNLSPGLVSLETCEPTISMKGLRIKCKTIINNQDYFGELLFKENGISGIISFDISRVVNIGDVISFDLAYEYSNEELFELFKNNKKEIVLMGLFPKMIYMDILKRSNGSTKSIVQQIKDYRFTIKGKGGFENSQITVGGVSLDDIKDTFESSIINGLYITGEVLNVDGASGGYNLYFAWLSGIASAKAIASRY